VENINDDVSSVVQQNNVATNYDVHAVRWWRRQTSFEFHWAGLDTFLEPWGQRTVPDKLLFQSWRELIFLRQARRKVSLILGIPAADDFFIVMLIVMVGMLVIIITVVFIVTFAVFVAIILCLGRCGICADQEHAQCPCDHPLHKFHSLLLKKTAVFERNAGRGGCDSECISTCSIDDLDEGTAR
jgi:hypothetical protein